MTTDAVPSTQETLSRRERRHKVVTEHMESENVQEWDRTMKTFSQPLYELVPNGRIIEGQDAVDAYWRKGRAAFPDQRNELIALHHTDAGVITEFWLKGTQLGGKNPSGRAFRCRMCAIFTFDDNDLMISERVYFDQNTISNQLTGKTPADQ